MGYYLADGIYPKWQTFVKAIPSPRGNKNKHFAKAQESARKDVERTFGVLQKRFAIIRGPSRMFKLKVLTNIMKACVILHIKDSSAHHQLQEDLIEHQWLHYPQQ
ncbi:putative harbinger transposase-derived protein [Helianthus annuus]|nr:putative harbinger transposase-derived protein [Helianthus annuus]